MRWFGGADRHFSGSGFGRLSRPLHGRYDLHVNIDHDNIDHDVNIDHDDHRGGASTVQGRSWDPGGRTRLIRGRR
jgi:hypothetical protein